MKFGAVTHAVGHGMSFEKALQLPRALIPLRIGRRSWGPSWSYGFSAGQDRLKYAEWWNRNGILTLQLESVKAVTNVRKLAKPGVDMFVFGAMDLSFDLYILFRMGKRILKNFHGGNSFHLLKISNLLRNRNK